MAAIHTFFDQRVTKTGTMDEIRTSVVTQLYPDVDAYQFGCSWERALSHQLVVPMDEEEEQFRIPDAEDNGVPMRVNTFGNMDDELEHLVESAMHSESNKDFHEKMKDLKCYFCEKLFFDARALKQHCSNAHPLAQGFLYQCTQCTHKSRNAMQHKKHVQYTHY